MKWHIGQKALALVNVYIYDPQSSFREKVIDRGDTYILDDYISGCCDTLIDVGKYNNEKRNQVEYQCRKCGKVHVFLPEKKIFFNENWFKPFDDNKKGEEKAIEIDNTSTDVILICKKIKDNKKVKDLEHHLNSYLIPIS